MWRAGPLNEKKKARTNILKGDESDKSDLGGVDKVDSSLCAFGVNAQLVSLRHCKDSESGLLPLCKQLHGILQTLNRINEKRN